MAFSMRSLPVVLLAGLLLMLPVSGVASSPPVVTVSHADGTLTVTPLVAYDHLSLRVATPDDRLFQAEGSGGPVHFRPFAIADYAPPDGSYLWEIRLTPRGVISAEVIERARRARESGDVEAEQALSTAARHATVIRSGGFRIVEGKLVMGDGSESPARPRSQSRGTILSPFAPASVSEDDGLQLVDQVIPDDLIVTGSICVGFDCVNNENFGFDTIRLKENNLRIKFEDTSVGTFPTTDWQLTANDSNSGGANKFSIEDIFQAHASNRVIARFGQVLGGWTEMLTVAGNGLALGTLGAAPLVIGTNNADRLHILGNGNIGMGQPAPVHPLQMASGAHVTAGGVWTDVSSREAKDDIRSLTADEARTTLAALEPVKFAYKADPTERHVGFVAEDVPDLVAQKDRKTLSPMDILAVLTRVVQEQQQRIEELTAKLAALEAARPR